jgi:protein phosphatase 1 regulatory subunit 7
MEGLESLTSLHTLDLSSNKIETLHNMSTLVKLEECWMNDNQIKTFDSVKQELVPLDASLRTVYLERNPVADEFLYRKTLASLLPSLTQIDASRIPNRKR